MKKDSDTTRFLNAEKIIEYFSFVRGNFLILTLSEIIAHVTFYVARPFLSLYIISLGGTTIIIGQINALSSLSRALIRIPGGYIADKFGRKKIIVLMSLAIGLTYLLYVFAVDWTWIMLGSILIALTSIYVPAYRAIMADSIPPEERGRAYMLGHLLPRISVIMSPYIGAVLIGRFSLDKGIRLSFLLAIFGILCATYLRAMFLKETIITRSPFRIDFLKHLHILKSLKSIRIFIIFRSIFTATTIMLQPLYVLYAVNVANLTIYEWSLIISGSLLISIILSFPISYLFDRYGRKIILILMFQILTLGLFVFSSYKSFAIIFLSYSIIFLAGTYSNSIFQAVEADLVRKDERGRAFSMIDVITFSISIPLSLFAGITYDYMSPKFPFQIGTLLILISSFFLILFREPKAKES